MRRVRTGARRDVTLTCVFAHEQRGGNVPKGVEAVINCALFRCGVLARAKTCMGWLCERLCGWHWWIDSQRFAVCIR
jgi:hypothetical protein